MHIFGGEGGNGMTFRNYRDYVNIAGVGSINGGAGGSETVYDDEIMEEIERQATAEKKKGAPGAEDDGDEERDEMLEAAIEVVVELGQASTTLLQRKLRLGYARAARIMDELEERGVIGQSEGAKPRKVLMSKMQYDEWRLRRMDE